MDTLDQTSPQPLQPNPPTQVAPEAVQSPKLEPMPYRTKSRLARGQSKQFMRQTLGLVFLSLLLLFVVIRFGIPLLIKLAVVLGDVRSGNNKEPQASEELYALVPPVLQPLPEATNSAAIQLSGFAKEDQKVTVFLNANPLSDVTAESDGEFSADLELRTGDNRVWAIARDGERESEKSAEMTIAYDSEMPELTIDSPGEGSTVTQDALEVRGLASEEVHLTVNGRLVSQQSDNSFVTTITLQEGENNIVVYAKDLAGNEVTKEIKVTYEP